MFNRRGFLKTAGMVSAELVAPSLLAAALPGEAPHKIAKNDQLQIALIGAGGQGQSDTKFALHNSVVPQIGYQQNVELSDTNKRRTYKLPPSQLMPALEANCTADCRNGYITRAFSKLV